MSLDYGDVRLNVVSADAPKSPDLQQFEAYMNRELPRKVRMALEAQMERLLGPIEETLKNELESIVQNCHKSLAETYLGTMQQNQLHPTNLSNTASSSSSRLFEITPPSDCPEADSSLNLYSQEISDFAQYSLPTPNSAEGSFEGPSNIATQQSWPPQLDASFSNTMGDDSWSSMWAQNFGHDFALDYAELGDIPVSFEGKGKGKAVVDEDFQVFHPSPSGED